MIRSDVVPAAHTTTPATTVRRRPLVRQPGLSQKAELLILCARIGFTPPGDRQHV
ncbi:MAG: hypothetical protein NW216_09320 [Hyphomicrobium sp.]|nr:hypothetical protein [Hyphomicrobium sp.]